MKRFVKNQKLPFYKWRTRLLKALAVIAVLFLLMSLILASISAPRGKTDPTEMTFYEYGVQNEKTVVLIHPSIVYYDFFEYVVPLLQNDFHVIVPALPGYDKQRPQSNFTSIEQIAAGIEQWLLQNGIDSPDVVYGCSMGGSIVLRMIADGKVQIKNAVLDGGITPYKAPWILTRWIALKDWAMMGLGKAGGIGLLEKAFATDDYTEEDLKYAADVFAFISNRTIWNTFDSCNNYKMPKSVPQFSGNLQYWYGEKEKSERKKDFAYMSKHFPNTEYIEMKGLGHAGMATLRPDDFADRIYKLVDSRQGFNTF